MIEHFKDLLLNVFFIFILLFIYYSFIRKRFTPIYNQWLLLIISSLLIILCMTYPLVTPSGYLIDLRQVPFILGALYGGRKLASILFVILISYRLLLDSMGIIEVVIVNALLLITLLLIIPKFHQNEELRHRVKLALLVSVLGIVYMMIVYSISFSTMLVIENMNFTILTNFLLIVQCLTIIFFVYLIEKNLVENKLKEELKRIEKINTISEIAASISHEVRNPLTITRGFIQLLGDDVIDKDKKMLYIQHSLQELDRASKIISDYLTFAKPSSEEMEVLDLKNELSHVFQLVTPYALYHNVELKMMRTDEPIYIKGEAQKLHQCLINLIKNSIEAIPDGGEVQIELYKSDHAIMTIKDTGVGMNKEDISKLGTPYFSTKSNGTGLGMMVVYSIIHAWKGKIEVESEPGKGTCFTISLLLEA